MSEPEKKNDKDSNAKGAGHWTSAWPKHLSKINEHYRRENCAKKKE